MNDGLQGEVIVFTGSLSINRADSKEIAENSGCKVSQSVSKKTTMVVVGSMSGNTNKFLKAQDLAEQGQSIRFLSEDKFFEILAQQ